MRLTFLWLLLLFFCCSQNKKAEIKKENSKNIALLIDTSITMLSPDFEPTRIKSVVAELKNIIKNKKENQFFSITVFSGNSYVLSPLTSNKDKLLNSINEIEKYWKILKPGTNIPEGLLNAAYTLKNADSNKLIVAFSDGPTNVNTYSVDLASDILRKEKIKVNAIILSPKDYELLPKTLNNKGNITFEKIKTKPLDKTLIEISSQTNGLHKIFNTSKEINNFNFQDFINESQKRNSEIKSSTSDSSTVAKIFTEIEIQNKTFENKMKN